MAYLCRDCFHRADVDAIQDCPACGGDRLVDHDELYELSIAHLDCDAFYAAIEIRDNPELAQGPLIIGGGKRGVVSTCCYKAREYGIHSAMPMFRARKLCPHATIVRPNMEKYARESKRIRALMDDLTPLVEPISIDEAFMDLSGTNAVHGKPPAATLAMLARDVEDEIGITVSIGLSYNKFLAKVASDFNKPRGFSIIGQREAVAFLRDQPVSLIWGVGKALTARLFRDGITLIGHLQQRDEKDLIARYGKMGRRLARFSHGRDNRRVDPRGERKSLSAETTFGDDIADLATLTSILWRLSEKTSRRLKKAELAGCGLTLKLKTANFQLRTRNRKLAAPTQSVDVIFQAGRELLKREVDGTKYRLIGIGLNDFSDPREADLDDLVDLVDGAKDRRQTDVEQAIDSVRDKFGFEAIGKGRGYSNPAGKQ